MPQLIVKTWVPGQPDFDERMTLDKVKLRDPIFVPQPKAIDERFFRFFAPRLKRDKRAPKHAERVRAAFPAFAILGKPLASDVGIFGAGVLIGPSLILTVDHVVRTGADNEEYPYRVYCPLTGILPIKKICVDGELPDHLAIIKLEHAIPDSLPPAQLGDEPTKKELLLGMGFGGGETGLFQVIPSRVRRVSKYIYIAREAHLGRRDSGAPLFENFLAQDVGDAAPFKVKGIYIGTRTEPDSHHGHPRFKRLAVSVEKLKAVLESAEPRSPQTRLEQLPVVFRRSSKVTYDPLEETKEYVVGACEQNEHTFKVREGATKSRLIVAVNGTTQPLRTRLGLRVRVIDPHGKKYLSGEPGPFQSLAFPPWNGAGGTIASGTWTVTVEAETEVTYQLWVTLYSLT